jgi:hypothetical protein
MEFDMTCPSAGLRFPTGFSGGKRWDQRSIVPAFPAMPVVLLDDTLTVKRRIVPTWTIHFGLCTFNSM